MADDTYHSYGHYPGNSSGPWNGLCAQKWTQAPLSFFGPWGSAHGNQGIQKDVVAVTGLPNQVWSQQYHQPREL